MTTSNRRPRSIRGGLAITGTQSAPPLAIESGQQPECPHCGTPVSAELVRCYWCETQLREVADWNPSPDQWFAAVGPYLIDRAAFVPGAARELAQLAVFQNGNPAGLIEAARCRLVAAFRSAVTHA